MPWSLAHGGAVSPPVRTVSNLHLRRWFDFLFARADAVVANVEVLGNRGRVLHERVFWYSFRSEVVVGHTVIVLGWKISVTISKANFRGVLDSWDLDEWSRNLIYNFRCPIRFKAKSTLEVSLS